MELIGSRFCRDADDAALVISELCGCVLRNDVEFLNSVYVRGITSFIVLIFTIQNAIEEILICLLTVSIDKWAASIVQGLWLRNSARIIRGGAGRKQRQLEIVSTRKR